MTPDKSYSPDKFYKCELCDDLTQWPDYCWVCGRQICPLCEAHTHPDDDYGDSVCEQCYDETEGHYLRLQTSPSESRGRSDMTPNEAIKIVKEKAAGRTRYAGQAEYVDEVLVAEIERLRETLKLSDSNLDGALKANAGYQGQVAELREELIDILDSAMRQGCALIGEHDHLNSDRWGWYDTCCLSTWQQIGERLVELGAWEEHPDFIGQSSYFRPKNKEER